MSGRSAYVRKEKTKTKDGGSVGVREWVEENPFPMPNGINDLSDFNHERHIRRAARSVVSSNLDETTYARVRRPVVPPLDVSGIEKSSFRALMDKKSDGVRRGLASLGFGRRKNSSEGSEDRPPTSATTRPRTDSRDADSSTWNRPGTAPFRERNAHHVESSEESPSRPPYGKLPPIPPGPQLKRWAGAGRPPHNWSKLRKDPELWDVHGDTLVFLSPNTHSESRPPPSFRLSSHVLESTRSKFLTTMLLEGYVDLSSDVESPGSSNNMGHGRTFWNDRNGLAMSPTPENTRQDPDGQISYEIYFPAPPDYSKVDTLRWHATTRNVFALLYRVPIVGLDLPQALRDLQNRLRLYMPPETDNAELVINYLTTRCIDDVRNDPTTALSLLLWSEDKYVQWHDGWREAFVHCVGMYNHVKELPGLHFVSPITRVLLERTSLESQVRVGLAQERLAGFKFQDMWSATSSNVSPERACFDRFRSFLVGFYEAQLGVWPPQSAADDGQWLTRGLATRLQEDFGALYNYLVNRDVSWDCAEERSSRKWNIVTSNPSHPIQPDTPDLPMTDILIAFDNSHRYPHIPHPYPLIPASISRTPKEGMYKANGRANKRGPPDDKMIERRVALAYADATNVYTIGSDLVPNRLVDGFVRFETNDRPNEVDPEAARRGRWVLVYGILQVLATISVDTPLMRYKDGVTYHLHPRLRGTPPWKGAGLDYEEASHEGSYCWLALKAWAAPTEAEVPMLDSVSVPFALQSPRQRATTTTTASGYSAGETESDTSSVRSPSTSRSSGTRWPSHRAAKEAGGLGLGLRYGPGIEKLEQWSIREEGRSRGRMAAQAVAIKDLDDYQSWERGGAERNN